jgi:Holliday junction resolvase
VEYECCQILKEQGHFAMRIPSRHQQGELRSIDVIAFVNGFFHVYQCKYRRKGLINGSQKSKEELERIFAFCEHWNAVPYLCYRELHKGLKFEQLIKK